MKFPVSLSGLAALATALVLAAPALAAAPPVNTQAPGYYRMPLGKFEITAINDGTFQLPMKSLLVGITPEKIDEALARM